MTEDHRYLYERPPVIELWLDVDGAYKLPRLCQNYIDGPVWGYDFGDDFSCVQLFNVNRDVRTGEFVSAQMVSSVIWESGTTRSEPR